MASVIWSLDPVVAVYDQSMTQLIPSNSYLVPRPAIHVSHSSYRLQDKREGLPHNCAKLQSSIELLTV